MGDLPYVKEDAVFHRANAGFSNEYQLVDVLDYQGRGESTPSPWFYQNKGEAEYVVNVYTYLCLLGYPANNISILTTYKGKKLLIRDVINRRCVPYDFIGPPSKVNCPACPFHIILAGISTVKLWVRICTFHIFWDEHMLYQEQRPCWTLLIDGFTF